MVRTIPQLRTLVEGLGGTLEVNRTEGSTELLADAPAGKVWKASFTHVLAGFTYKGPPAWLADTLADLQDRIGHGLEDCTDPDCEVCGG
jgi:hypothetical protein